MTQVTNFDAEAFMNSTTSDSNSTSLPLVPVGEYAGVITKVEPKSGIIGKGERAGETWAQLRVSVETEDPAALEGTDLKKRIVSTGVMLDLTETGSLDMGKGKNVQLGRLREATNLNNPGQPFSPMMFVGRSVRFVVSHRIDPNDSEKIYDEIKAWRSL